MNAKRLVDGDVDGVIWKELAIDLAIEQVNKNSTHSGQLMSQDSM